MLIVTLVVREMVFVMVVVAETNKVMVFFVLFYFWVMVWESRW